MSVTSVSPSDMVDILPRGPAGPCHAAVSAARTRPAPGCIQQDNPRIRRLLMAEFEYISKSRLQYRNGYRNAYLGEVPEPVVYGVQGALREYYGAPEGPPIASTLDHIVAAVAG